ncbi:type I 3-dehydroquinate dehydratase [Eubacterium sp. MSJ-13]|uniref:type I 3-dehydroquinate dehydratase n=1 Tax=Eubacterium sp. MSJ-13 TaxID=2841513 RepID=UPI001C112140|nr:type I 3-dehydroquinate dehydratase [Eubacterium sp. MSJ-13]MBU5479255.1 type I 3-dehydroquinate dehydratase [Eubacterium sp. MSJ-13]
MMVKVKNVEIGTEVPKICAPIVEKYQEDILEMGENLMAKKSVDIIEWRIDFFEDCFNTAKLIETAGLLRAVVPKKPLLATFRTKNEGGEKDIEKSSYIKMLEALSESGYIDMIDVEAYFMDKIEIEKLIKGLKERSVVVGSYHDFEKTPLYDEIQERLTYMKEIGADIPKMACMPEKRSDVFRLMSATDDFVIQNEDIPVITMSMGEIGKVSRIAGRSFGSAVTFGCLGKASAPGQINVDDLKLILDML